MDNCIFLSFILIGLLLFHSFLVYYMPSLHHAKYPLFSAARDRHPATMVSLFDHFLAWFSAASPEPLPSASSSSSSSSSSFVLCDSSSPPPPIDYFHNELSSSPPSPSSSSSSSSGLSSSPSPPRRRLRVDDGCLVALWLACAPFGDRMRDAWRIIAAQRPEWKQVQYHLFILQ